MNEVTQIEAHKVVMRSASETMATVTNVQPGPEHNNVMKSLPDAFNAVVLGASGTIGKAFANVLSNTPNCRSVISISRQTHAGFDITDEERIAKVVRELRAQGPFHFIIDATGALDVDGTGPEKCLAHLNADKLTKAFMINSIGPALLIKHFVGLLPTDSRSVYAKLSARVGSISDNRKGGWYGYRASKAALNMILQTAAIEIARTRPDAIVAALQPGTVHSRLTAPYVNARDATDAAVSVRGLLDEIDNLSPNHRATFIDYQGKPVAW